MHRPRLSVYLDNGDREELVFELVRHRHSLVQSYVVHGQRAVATVPYTESERERDRHTHATTYQNIPRQECVLYVCACVRGCVCVCVCARVCVRICVCVHARIYGCVYMCVSVPAWVTWWMGGRRAWWRAACAGHRQRQSPTQSPTGCRCTRARPCAAAGPRPEDQRLLGAFTPYARTQTEGETERQTDKEIPRAVHAQITRGRAHPQTGGRGERPHARWYALRSAQGDPPHMCACTLVTPSSSPDARAASDSRSRVLIGELVTHTLGSVASRGYRPHQPTQTHSHTGSWVRPSVCARP
jgi:hypothetical protein